MGCLSCQRPCSSWGRWLTRLHAAPGYGDDLNLYNSFRSMMAFIEAQNHRFLRIELDKQREVGAPRAGPVSRALSAWGALPRQPQQAHLCRWTWLTWQTRGWTAASSACRHTGCALWISGGHACHACGSCRVLWPRPLAGGVAASCTRPVPSKAAAGRFSRCCSTGIRVSWPIPGCGGQVYAGAGALRAHRARCHQGGHDDHRRGRQVQTRCATGQWACHQARHGCSAGCLGESDGPVLSALPGHAPHAALLSQRLRLQR